MKQSHNEKGEFVYLYPPNGINNDKVKLLEWINQKAKEGYYFNGSVPVLDGEILAIFWKPDKVGD